ncbi:hypothetical protein H4R34_004245 [Dimargaris verticillata]|uniref:Uncharacterized protein n=1 Tax=Dimargaris verticillata TaxID=2761393 RepID=A0A9W8B302_9FUNG|nr:hypothetical protein H4R34_004245 [Dimargaris verticillata]
MPHKRRKHKDPKRFDAKPKSTQDNDMPGRFQWLLRAAADPKTDHRAAEAAKSRKSLKRLPGESDEAFSHRVKEATQKSQTGASKNQPRKTAKRKEHLAAKRQKVQNKAQERQDECQFRDFHHLQDQVRFNEVAMAPPVLKQVPRPMKQVIMPGESKPTPAAALKRAHDAPKDLLLNAKLAASTHALDDAKAKAKHRLQAMSTGQRQVLDKERLRIIAQYRAQRAAKLETINAQRETRK